MKNVYITINQLAEFSQATTSGKNRIIRQQLTPSKLRVFWYQLAKARVRTFLRNVRDQTPLTKAIAELEKRVPQTPRQASDRIASIKLLECVKSVKLHSRFAGIRSYEVIKPDDKSLNLAGVEIGVTPEAVIRTVINGKTYFGAVKFHYSQSDPFDSEQCKYIAASLVQYLKDKVVGKGERVLPELCIVVDVFSERVVTADVNMTKELKQIVEICNEVKALWPK